MSDAGFELFPSIDLRDGKCVRLYQGDFDAETVYDDDPVAVAREFEAEGAPWIHVVDLDAARTGDAANLAVIEAICAAVSCRIQTGGGVRTVEAAGDRLLAGVARVVVGTAAVEHPELVDELCAVAPRAGRGRPRRARPRGRHPGLGRGHRRRPRRCSSAGSTPSGVSALVVTSIGHDGTLKGPDLDQLAAVLEATAVPVIASGGVGTLDDLRDLAQFERAGRRFAGAIVGKAIYEHRFTVAEALAVVA